MRIVADENVDRLVIERLRNDGHDIIAIIQESPASPDQDVLSSSDELQALLITEDKDFGDLVFHKKRSHFGVLLVRLGGLPRQKRIDMVCDLIAQRGSELANAFSVLSPNSVRIRSLD